MSTKLAEENTLREKVWKIINLIQANQLFVHSGSLEIKYYDDRKETIITKKLPEILTVCILNALVPNSAMLLVGGHGGGKTTLVKLLGRMFTASSLDEIESSIIRGHPQLTEEKLVGTLKLGKLMKTGEEEVVWRNFIKNFWKIIDEVNRLTPYAQDILLSLLAEGTVKYYDSITTINKFCLFATINPQDVGTFELSQPFLDRYGISIPISMPASQDLNLILKGKDEKYSGFDELIQVPQVLTIDELMEIWYYVNKINSINEVDNYIHAIVREFTLCARIDKGNTEDLIPSSGLCSGCHFNTTQNVCNKIDSILSVRVAKDLLRYSKALAWLLRLKAIDVNIVNTIAPYVISHRTKYSPRELEKSPYWGNKYEFTKRLLDLVLKRFRTREKCYEIVEKFRNGAQEKNDLTELRKYQKNDLIVKFDLIPFVNSIKNKEYTNLAQKIKDASKNGDISTLAEIRDKLITDMEFPNRADLINWCNLELYKQTVTDYVFKYIYWKEVWADIATEFPNLDKILKDTFTQRQTKQIRTEDILLEINVTGTEDDSLVNIQVSGGSDALKLRTILDNIEYIEKEI
ncbi:MAG: AAA domain-containing protein [Candidatus Lokiarchaeota archaeon]|nr:AAA domain-containing protein [Candidatus Lokiarchaeota archaeon]MBD3340459.1 AAA domain-containing protein [Candidatus Lokiarchaeota archaeon]